MPPPAASVPQPSRLPAAAVMRPASWPPAVAAVLPHPPLVVPELAGAAVDELDPLRGACRQALSAVVAGTDGVVVVGAGPVWGMPLASAVGSFRPYGADIQVGLPALVDLDPPGLPPPARLDTLPLSLAVAAHLLAGLDAPPTRLHAATVPASLGPGAAAAVGRALTAAARQDAAGSPPGTVGLVVMADLSACRTEGAPGAFRPEAAAFDASVAEAVRSGRLERLLDLDPASAADLLVTGLVPLQVLAGAYGAEPSRGGGAGTGPGSAVRGRAPGGPGSAVSRDRGDAGGSTGEYDEGDAGRPTGPRGRDGAGGAAARGRALYEDAPYGVGYLVALLGAP
jgi:hypothetical protein